MHNYRLPSLLALSLVALPAWAHAQDPARDTGGGPARVFGAPNQLAISSDAALVIQHESHDTTSISIAPAADFFVVENVSVGGSILLEYNSAGDAHTTRFGIGPRVGYNFAFTDMLGLWPKIGFSYSHTNTGVSHSDGLNTVSVSTSGDHFTLNLFVPVMFHPVPHFFVGFGPFLDTDLSGDDKTTSYGGKLTIG
ncbi:MAG TPA: hypothetical protein VGI70_16255, partial [Polyangiales bacterium]